MASTLPRTRSMTAASSTSLPSITKDRVRPVSLCEGACHGVVIGGMVRRSPSQAHSLATTVPTSLVPRTLGGRHAPTRGSLRHSRMVVHAKSRVTPNGLVGRARWVSGGVGRVGILAISAQVLVGLMTVTLAGWFMLWAPSIRFTEVPHYAGVPVLLAGVSGAVTVSCCDKRRHRTSAAVVKGVVAVFCCMSIVTCLSVCIFTAMHLIALAPMTCRNHHDVIVQSPTMIMEPPSISPPPVSVVEDNSFRITKHTNTRDKIIDYNRNLEGSGEFPGDLELDAEYYDYSDLELKPSILKSVPAHINEGIRVNITICVCQSFDKQDWSRTLRYPDLSCLEVNHILPVLFVASCVLCSVGSILSVMVLYLLWTSRSNIYGRAKPSEVRPFIFTSNFKTTNSQIGLKNDIKSGDALYR